MSWLCEVCGYENQFDDEAQPTECLCCGEPASERILLQVYLELEACRREARARAYIEEVRRKRELRRQEIDRMVKRALSLAKAVPVAVILATVGALACAILSLKSNDLTFAAWNQQMQSNMSALNWDGSALFALQNGAGYISGVVEDRKSKVADNVAGVVQNGFEKYGDNDNFRIIIGSVDERQKNATGNTIQLHGTVGVNLENIENQAEEIGQRNFGAARNLASNFQVFWSNATENIDALIGKIAKRGAAPDG